MHTEILPFQPSHLPDAALLLAKRHQRNRAAEPALPARFEDVAVTRVAIETLWNKPGARGGVALHNGQRVKASCSQEGTHALHDHFFTLQAIFCKNFMVF